MGLEYPGEWKFDGVGFGIPQQATDEFVELIERKISPDSQDGLELFKSAFGYRRTSSNYGFALTDLREAMASSSSNAAEFVNNLWAGIEAAKIEGLKTPKAEFINSILERHGVLLRIEPPNLVLVGGGDAILLESQAADADPAEAIPRFVLGEQVGKGGYGVVHRATRTTAVGEFDYAVKILHPHPFVKNQEKAFKRFQREVQALRHLQHRAIVSYYEAGLTGDKRPYVVMPFIEGVDLREAAAATDSVSVLTLFIEIMSGLDHAHRQNVIHRDLKPSNVRVRHSDSQPIILDFGSAYLLDELTSDTLTTDVVGTVGYIPKEVFDDPKARSPLQDIYACGVMLYECLAGHSPDRADYQAIASIRDDDVYQSVDEVVLKAVARVDKRTKSAQTMLEELSIARDILSAKG